MDFIFFDVQIVSQFREEQDTSQVKRIIHIQMDMKQRLLKLHWVQLVVEFYIIFLSQIAWRNRPRRVGIIYDIIYLNFLRFCTFCSAFRQRQLLFFGPEFNWDLVEFVILCQKLTDFEFFQKLGRIFCNMKDNLCPSFRFFCIFQRIFRASVTDPTYGFCIIFIRFSQDFHFFCHHKSRIKSETKMPDNAGIFSRILIFLQKLFCSRKRDLVDIFFNLFAGHPNSLIFDSQRFRIFINFHFDDWVAIFHLCFTYCGEVFQFGCRICRVRNQLTKKNLVVAVKKLFNQWKNILHRYINTSCCHIYIIFCLQNFEFETQKKDHPKINDKLSLDKTTKDTKALMRSLLSFTPLRT